MTNRLKKRLYTKEKIAYKNQNLCYVENEDGTLYSGSHRTKICEKDLPDWFIFGRYYKCWGYLSAKGITDLLYVPNKFTNHFLKDDCLYIAYDGKITEDNSSHRETYPPVYNGYDERVWGSEILSMLRGAKEYSCYDISDIIQQLIEKRDWLSREYPNEFGTELWRLDVEKYFSEK